MFGLLTVSSAVRAQPPFDVLAAFGSPGPQNPQASLVQGADGNFFGTTSSGGDANAGTVFQLTTAGVLTQIYAFTGGADGGNPTANLVQGADHNFYGMTTSGGAGGVGTIFHVTSSGSLTVLYSFTGGTDGANPNGGLMRGADGSFYGTTSSGGGFGAGTVFHISSSGVFSLLYTFTGGADGGSPFAGLIQGADGNFYGTASSGGPSSAGTVFQMTPAGSLRSVYAFTGGSDGGYPIGGVIEATDGNFYGTTYQGGDFGCGRRVPAVARWQRASAPRVHRRRGRCLSVLWSDSGRGRGLLRHQPYWRGHQCRSGHGIPRHRRRCLHRGACVYRWNGWRRARRRADAGLGRQLLRDDVRRRRLGRWHRVPHPECPDADHYLEHARPDRVRLTARPGTAERDGGRARHVRLYAAGRDGPSRRDADADGDVLTGRLVVRHRDGLGDARRRAADAGDHLERARADCVRHAAQRYPTERAGETRWHVHL